MALWGTGTRRRRSRSEGTTRPSGPFRSGPGQSASPDEGLGRVGYRRRELGCDGWRGARRGVGDLIANAGSRGPRSDRPVRCSRRSEGLWVG